MATAEYQVLVNWQDPAEQSFGDFETDLDSWTPASGVLFNRTTELAHSGSYSVNILDSISSDTLIFDALPGFDTFVFGTDLGPDIGLVGSRVLTGLEVGTTYAASGWVYIPSGARHLKLTTSGFLTETESSHVNDWVFLETTFLAASSTQTINLYAITTENSTDVAPYIDDFNYQVAGVDITCLVLGTRSSIDTNEGRDTARALSSVSPAESNFEFVNEDRLYSPNNPASILNTKTATNVPVQIRAIFEGRIYLVYNGFIDQYSINQELPGFSTVDVRTIDVLGKLAATDISTGLYQNIRTGTAIGYLLDEIDWPEGKRKLDAGSTVLDWWWEDDTNGLDAVNKLLSDEGLPSLVYVDDVGDFVFKDRHHRYTSTFSTAHTAHFRCEDGESVV